MEKTYISIYPTNKSIFTHNPTPKHNNIQAVGKFEFIFKQELKKVKDNEEERANK